MPTIWDGSPSVTMLQSSPRSIVVCNIPCEGKQDYRKRAFLFVCSQRDSNFASIRRKMKYFRKAVGVVRTSGKWISARIGGGAFIPTAFREMGLPAPVV